MTGAAPLTDIRACVFDAYGTLFDFASAAMRCADALGDKANALTPLWRDKQLQYTWLRAAQRRHADFWQVTGDALDFALETLAISDERGTLRQRLMDCYLTLDAFPEVPEMLRQLKAAGFATAILSNGTPAMLAAAVQHAGIGRALDHVLSVEEVGASSRRPRSIGSRSTAWAFAEARSLSNHRMHGIFTQRRLSACARSGAIAAASGANGCPARPIARSRRSRNCRNC